jgi:GT2 family glycosyltransferase
MPQLSIIIPTYNRPDYLRATVEQVLEQNFTDFELIIIDQSPEPISLPSDSRLHYYHFATRLGAPQAKNEGIARANGEIFVFLDDDIKLSSKDFLAEHSVCYTDPIVGGVAGRVLDQVVRPNTRSTQSIITWGGRTVENLTGTKACTIGSARGANMSLRAEVFRRVGGFDPGYTGNALLEELDMTTRVRAAGWRLVFTPKAELVHFSAPHGGVRSNPQSQEYFRFRNTAYYVAKHRGLIGLLPFALTFSIIAARRAWQWRAWGEWLVLMQAAYEGSIAGAHISRRDD